MNRDIRKPKRERLLGFLVEEHKVLRDEILKRIELQHQLIALALIAIGAFLPLGIQGSITILLLYPVLAMFIATAWSHDEVRIRQTAEYIKAVEMKISNGKVGWEHVRQSRIAKEERFGSRSLLAARGIFVGTQFVAVGVSSLKTEFPVEDVVLLSLDGIAIVVTVYLLRKYKAKSEIYL